MFNKITLLLLSNLLSLAVFASNDPLLSAPKDGVQWKIYAGLTKPEAEFFYSNDYIKRVGDLYEVQVLKNYKELQYVGEGYGAGYAFMSSIEVQHINCKQDKYQSKLVKAFKESNAKVPAFYSQQTKGDWISSDGNGGQKHLHKIVCKG
jgi:hypothetical protein